MVRSWVFHASGLLMYGLLLCSAVAQTTKPVTEETKRAASTAAQAAREVSKGKGSTSSTFLTEQAKRAGKIRDEAIKDEKTAEFFKQRTAVDAAKSSNGEWARGELKRASRIANATMDEAANQAGIDGQKPKRSRYLVFVSQSMGETALASSFELGRGKTDVAYVFIGFLKDQNPLDFQKKLLKHQGKSADKLINVSLDPPSFGKYAVKSVPTIVRIDDNENMVAKVTGLINFGWLRDQVDDGKKGDLGVRGKVFPIAEVNLIEVMKAKAAAIDYKKEMAGAGDRYFSGLTTIDLPYATKQRARKVIPEVNVSEDIVDHRGVVRYRKGDQISLKEELARAPVIIVFNSQDPYHVAFAKTMVKKAPANKKVILLTTRIDRKGGVPAYARQEYAIGTPVYLLMENVRSTFGIESIPTVVTPGENEFIVVEVPLKQGVSGNARTNTP